MNFMLRHNWHISFLEADCKTSLPLTLTFADPEKITEMQGRFGSRILADIASMEHGISIGRGGIWLELELAQYALLKQRRVNLGP